MALFGGLTAGCGSTASQAPASQPKPPATSQKARVNTPPPKPTPVKPASKPSPKYSGDPAEDALTWFGGSGYEAVLRVVTDAATMPRDPTAWTAAQYKKLMTDIKAAINDPILPSIDPKGAYADYLQAVGQAARDAENGYTYGLATARYPR